MNIHQIYDEYVAPNFDADYFGLNEESRNIALGQLKICKKSFETILDLGVGTGEFLKALGEIYPQAQLWGVDSSQKMIEIARKKFRGPLIKRRVRLIHDDIQSAGHHIAPETIDLVILHFILNYVDHQKVLLESRRALKSGGYLSISNCTSDSFPVLHSLATQFVSEQFLQTTFSVPENLDSLKKTANDLGFDTIEERIFHKSIIFPTFDDLYKFALYSGWVSNPFFLQMTDEEVASYRKFGQSLFPLHDEFRAVILLVKKR